jgi:alginate O-acetyltransferase complex protein AlgI
MIVAVTLLIVFVVSVINEKGKSVRALLAQRPAAVRWAAFYALILFIIVFGAYGKGYIPVDPMYANF